ncbi:hypothetical protein GCM10020000_51820 [Streptomyces olivoverticillatus]
MFPGGGGRPEKEADADAARRLGTIAPLAADTGVHVLLETHDSHRRAQDVERVLGPVGHGSIGALWDVLHTWLGGESPAVSFPALAPHLGYVQVKDVASAEDTAPLPLGAGGAAAGCVRGGCSARAAGAAGSAGSTRSAGIRKRPTSPSWPGRARSTCGGWSPPHGREGDPADEERRRAPAQGAHLLVQQQRRGGHAEDGHQEGEGGPRPRRRRCAAGTPQAPKQSTVLTQATKRTAPPRRPS